MFFRLFFFSFLARLYNAHPNFFFQLRTCFAFYPLFLSIPSNVFILSERSDIIAYSVDKKKKTFRNLPIFSFTARCIIYFLLTVYVLYVDPFMDFSKASIPVLFFSLTLLYGDSLCMLTSDENIVHCSNHMSVLTAGLMPVKLNSVGNSLFK